MIFRNTFNRVHDTLQHNAANFTREARQVLKDRELGSSFCYPSPANPQTKGNIAPASPRRRACRQAGWEHEQVRDWCPTNILGRLFVPDLVRTRSPGRLTTPRQTITEEGPQPKGNIAPASPRRRACPQAGWEHEQVLDSCPTNVPARHVLFAERRVPSFVSDLPGTGPPGRLAMP